MCGHGCGSGAVFLYQLRLAPGRKVDHGRPGCTGRSKGSLQSKKKKKDQKKVTGQADYMLRPKVSLQSTRLTRTFFPTRAHTYTWMQFDVDPRTGIGLQDGGEAR